MKNGVRGPDPRLVEVAEEYARQNGIDYKRQAEYVKVDVDRARQIAKAYDEMKDDPKDPKVREAYQDLIDQTLAQYRALENAGYEFWFYDPANNPYPSPYDAMYDLRMNRRMGVFPTRAGFGSDAESSVPLDTESNPLLVDTGVRWSYGSPDGPKQSATANDVFRAVHDAFGHGLEGAGFRDRGEENAWQAHARLFRGPALGALTSETRGQNSWVNFGPYADFNRNASQEDTVYAPQKAGLMPSWTWTLGRANDMEDEVKHVHSWLTIKNHSQQEGMKQAMQIINHFGPGNEQKALIYLQEEMNRVVNVILRSQKNNNISSAKFLKDSEERITTFENAVNIGRYEGMRRYYNTIIDSIRK
jgi:hypothetical protein